MTIIISWRRHDVVTSVTARKSFRSTVELTIINYYTQSRPERYLVLMPARRRTCIGGFSTRLWVRIDASFVSLYVTRCCYTHAYAPHCAIRNGHMHIISRRPQNPRIRRLEKQSNENLPTRGVQVNTVGAFVRLVSQSVGQVGAFVLSRLSARLEWTVYNGTKLRDKHCALLLT